MNTLTWLHRVQRVELPDDAPAFILLTDWHDGSRRAPRISLN